MLSKDLSARLHEIAKGREGDPLQHLKLDLYVALVLYGDSERRLLVPLIGLQKQVAGIMTHKGIQQMQEALRGLAMADPHYEALCDEVKKAFDLGHLIWDRNNANGAAKRSGRP